MHSLETKAILYYKKSVTQKIWKTVSVFYVNRVFLYDVMIS